VRTPKHMPFPKAFRIFTSNARWLSNFGVITTFLYCAHGLFDLEKNFTLERVFLCKLCCVMVKGRKLGFELFFYKFFILVFKKNWNSKQFWFFKNLKIFIPCLILPCYFPRKTFLIPTTNSTNKVLLKNGKQRLIPQNFNTNYFQLNIFLHKYFTDAVSPHAHIFAYWIFIFHSRLSLH
jgi:hypothetical protein